MISRAKCQGEKTASDAKEFQLKRLDNKTLNWKEVKNVCVQNILRAFTDFF